MMNTIEKSYDEELYFSELHGTVDPEEEDPKDPEPATTTEEIIEIIRPGGSEEENPKK